MTIKQKIKILSLGALLLGGLILTAVPLDAYAAGNKGCEVDTALIDCSNVNTDADGVENTGVWSILLTIINILTAGVGVIALGGIVYGSILYTSAGGNQEQVKKAMGIFSNVVIGVVAFAGMWALLNFIIPGGVF
ncbi:MAG: hypothetical protein WAQ27_05020 [Candidatus Microsaccharimonas sp.]